MSKFICLAVLFWSFSFSLWSSDSWYFSDVQNIPLRKNPNKDAAVNSYVPTHTRLKLIQKSEEWSKIITEFGDEGWVRTEVITDDKPLSYKFKVLESENLQALKINKELSKKNSELLNEMKQMKESALLLDSVLNKSKNEVAIPEALQEDLVQLKQDYKKVTLQLNDYYLRNADLEKQVDSERLYLILGGGALVLLGLLFGRVSRKSTYSSRLRF